MRRTHCFLTFLLIAGLFSAKAPPARAVVTADNPNSTSNGNTSAPVGIAGWNNVGVTDGASAIYLGNGWIMTASHVGIGNTFTTSSGQAFSTAGGGGTRLTDPTTGQPADIILYQLPGNSSSWPNLPQLNLASSPQVTSNNAYYNIGYGAVRTTSIQYYDSSFNSTTAGSATYGGFGYSNSPGVIESYGRNYVYNLGTTQQPQSLTSVHVTGPGGSPDYGYVTAFVGAFYNNLGDYQNNNTTKFGDQIVSGDSGGGVFNSQNQLIGMMDAESLYTNQPGNTALFGDQSYSADIGTYYNQIYAITGVPEPTSLALLFGACPLLLRRRSARTKPNGLVQSSTK